MPIPVNPDATRNLDNVLDALAIDGRDSPWFSRLQRLSGMSAW